MNKQKLRRKYEELWKEHSPFHEPVSYTSMAELFLKDLKLLDEPEKVKIPQFVADWIEDVKKNGLLKETFSGNHIGISVGDNVYRVMYFIIQKRLADDKFTDWFLDNTNTFARAWLDGYEVEPEPEKEKRYWVRVRGLCGNHETLNCEKHSKKWLFSDREENSLYKTKHTRKELEEAGFGWVFDCEGIEIEEVE